MEPRQPGSVLGDEAVAVLSDDVGHLEGWPVHGFCFFRERLMPSGLDTLIVSSGLATAVRCFWERWRYTMVCSNLASGRSRPGAAPGFHAALPAGRAYQGDSAVGRGRHLPAGGVRDPGAALRYTAALAAQLRHGCGLESHGGGVGIVMELTIVLTDEQVD